MKPTSENLQKFYQANFSKTYKAFYYKLLNREEAEDLTSEAFLALAQAISKGLEIDSWENYLQGIVRNVFNEFLKKKYRTETISYREDLLPQESGNSIPEKIFRLLPKLLEELPEAQQIILKLRLLDKLNLKEIALKLNRDMNYVKTTQKRGIKSLKKIIACTPINT